MLAQQRLPPPLTHTVKSSLFMHVHSSPLSLAARLHRCHANCSHHVNNGWTFSGQTSYMYICFITELFELQAETYLLWKYLKVVFFYNNCEEFRLSKIATEKGKHTLVLNINSSKKPWPFTHFQGLSPQGLEFSIRPKGVENGNK